MVVNPVNVVRLLILTFNVANDNRPIVFNNEESEMHDVLKNILIRSRDDTTFEVDNDVTLEFLQEFRPHSVEFVDDDRYPPSREEVLEVIQFEEEECAPEERDIADLEYKTKAVTFWKSEKKRRSFEAVKHRFKRVKSLQQLYRWEVSIQKGGTRREKLLEISEYVFNKFVTNSEAHAIIHNLDLRKWAMEANEEIRLRNFRAYGTNTAEINQISSAFVQEIKPYIAKVGSTNTFNADESGSNLELHSGRTLVPQGSKAVGNIVQSIFAATHNYTVLPTVSASGRLLSPLFMVLKEQSGTFGPRVVESMFHAENIYVTASSSGKLTTALFTEWFTKVYLPNTGSQTVLSLDSWTGHCPSNLKNYISADNNVNILTTM